VCLRGSGDMPADYTGGTVASGRSCNAAFLGGD
jgi:hypothetical protein